MTFGPGRPLSLFVDSAIRHAVREVLVEEGYRAVTVERVCREAKVDRGAVYRRWPSRTVMVFDVALPRGRPSTAADCGSLEEDLRQLVHSWLAYVSTPHASRALFSLTADMSEDRELIARLRERVIAPQRSAVRELLLRAHDRGEIEEIEADHLTAQLIGTTLAWTRLVGRPPEDLAEHLTRALVALARE